MRRLLATATALALCAAAAAGCGDEAPAEVRGGGGSGGIAGGGGAGGSGESSARQVELCTRSCEVLVPCTRDYREGEEQACIDRCLRSDPQEALLESCVECLAEIACDGATLGCQRGPACDMAYDLRVSGEGLSDLEGRTARVLVAEAVEGERWVDFAREVTIVDGAFDVRFRGGLPAWEVPFDVVVLVDANGDRDCEPMEDRAWQLEIGEPRRDEHVVIGPDHPQRPDACAYWSEAPTEIVLAGSGFDALEGKTAIAASVWVDSTFLSIGPFVTMPIEAGAFRFQLHEFGDYVEEMAPESELRMAWMVDLDGDWICSEADAGGHVPVPPVSGLEQRVEVGPTAAGSAPCELLRGLGHDVRLRLHGYEDFEGRAVDAALLDEQGRAVGLAGGEIADGAVELGFAGMAIPGSSYQVAVWIDADESLVCEAPPDGAWILPVGRVEADVERTFTHDGAAPDGAVCTHFDVRQ